MMQRPGKMEKWKETSMRGGREKEDTEREIEILTGKKLEDARDGEPLPFLQGEELSHEHKDAQDGEYTSED